MSKRFFDQLHDHLTWKGATQPEYSEDGRLHRHRILEPGGVVRFTAWEHNKRTHTHRLPDGAWSRPRRDLNPPRPAVAAAV